MAVALIPVLKWFGRHLPPLRVVIEVNENVIRSIFMEITYDSYNT